MVLFGLLAQFGCWSLRPLQVNEIMGRSAACRAQPATGTPPVRVGLRCHNAHRSALACWPFWPPG